jgi:hypothetical protein
MYDVFISYASKDKTMADTVCARLESAGIRCWIAPRDIVPGTSYGEAIIKAIQLAKVMVLVFSSNANSSAHIPKEVERAVSHRVVIIPFRIEDVAPGNTLDYFIGSVHWLDAMTPPLEKHLDELAATIHKLLPGLPDAPVVVGAGTPGLGRRSAQSGMPGAVIRPASGGEGARASSSKTILTGVVAVAVLAVVVLGVMLLRGGGNSQVPAKVPNPAEIPSPGQMPGPANPPMAPNPPAPVARGGADPIVGCYQWFNNAPVVIRADGSMVAGPFTARWRLVSASHRAYTFTWPEATDTVTTSPDQQSLSGANQYGFPASGTRIAGSSGLAGSWRWPNGVPVIVNPNGSFTAASFRGRWQAVDASRGIYTLTWPNPVDSVTLSADGSRVSGSNQYGVAISGVRIEPCVGN